MISRFLPRRRSDTVPPVIPEGQRVYAVGDVHGCASLLSRLLVDIKKDDDMRGLAATKIIFLGDLIDRGPDSAGVIEHLHQMKEAGSDVRFLMGNHEEIFLGAVEGEPKALRLFCRIGGRETVLSYGVEASDYDKMDYSELVAILAERVPSHHVQFVGSFENLIEVGDYAFVHAGVMPNIPLDEQRRRDLRWIRDPFLNHDKRLPKMIVHGHTISDGLDIRPHRIGVDTGAYETGRLTALGLEGGELWTVEVTEQ